jgi:hypothetical protein
LRVRLCDCAQRQAAACYLLQKDATRIFGACGLAGHNFFLSGLPEHTGGHYRASGLLQVFFFVVFV